MNIWIKDDWNKWWRGRWIWNDREFKKGNKIDSEKWRLSDHHSEIGKIRKKGRISKI